MKIRTFAITDGQIQRRFKLAQKRENRIKNFLSQYGFMLNQSYVLKEKEKIQFESMKIRNKIKKY